jgi:hypothetical protein
MSARAGDCAVAAAVGGVCRGCCRCWSFVQSLVLNVVVVGVLLLGSRERSCLLG